MQESSGIITLIDMLEADLDKEMQEMTVEEKDRWGSRQERAARGGGSKSGRV